MNLFELQERLKDFSQDQLVNEMRNPSGSAPQYLVLSELQRRTRMQQEAMAQPQQQSTVAEEAVAAAGMPQGGLAQMAQAMAPQTDMVQNTAAQPVERMREGGMLGTPMQVTADLRQQDNLMLQNGPLGGYHEYLTETYAEPRVDNFVGRVQQMERQEFGPMMNQIQPNMFGPQPAVGFAPLPQPMSMARIPENMFSYGVPNTLMRETPPLQLAEGGAVTGDDILQRVKSDPRAALNTITQGMTGPGGLRQSFMDFINSSGQQVDGPSRQELAAQMNTGPTDARMAALEQYKSLYDRPTLPVRGMSEGGRATGLAAINRNLADFMPMRRGARGNRFMNLTPDAMGAGIAVDALMADPRVQAAATSSNMSPEEYISALNSEQFQTALDMLNTPVENAPMRDEGRISDEEFMAGRYDGPGGAYSVTERSGVPGRARLSEAGLTGVEPVPTVTAEDIRRMANEDPSDYRGDGVSVIGAGIAGPYTEFLERMAETPLFPEREPEPFASIPENINRARFADIPTGTLPANEGRLRTPDSTYDEVMPFDRNVYGSDDPYALPADRGMRTDVSGPGFTYDPAGVVLSEEDFQRGLGTTDFGGSDPESLPPEIILQQERERIARQYEDQAMQDEADMPAARMTDNELANLELAGFDATDQSGGDGIGFDDIGRAIGEAVGFGDAMQLVRDNAAIEEEREASRERFVGSGERAPDFVTMMPEDRPIDLTRTDADGEGGSGGSGGSGGGSGGGAGDGAGMGGSDDRYDQDKWLALAQFGLSLMSSTAPTFGQAIGEAGQTGLQALLGARSARDERIEAARTRADRLAAAARSAASQTGRFRDDEMSAIDNAIGELRQYRTQFVDEFGTPRPGSEETLANIDAEIETYRLLQRAGIMERFPELYQASE